MNVALKEKLAEARARIEEGISALVPGASTRPQRLHAAMQHSLAAGGKRIRPVLLLAVADARDHGHDAMAAAVAIECLHTYTLIHDDLPALDDSPMRRGQPSCHAAFDEATAILAGDALLTFPFQLLTRAYCEVPTLAACLVSDLAEASGSECLIGGQMEDIENEGKAVTPDTLKFIHENKTAALLTAALRMGARFWEADQAQLAICDRAGHHLGMCFQIIDDILDATADGDALGKPSGSDAAAEKTTYVTLHGLAEARRIAGEHTASAVEALEELGGRVELLVEITRDLERRIS